MTDIQIEAANRRQADLEAAKAAFFASGGRAIVLASFSFTPHPPRKDVAGPKSRTAIARSRKDCAAQAKAKRDAHVERIREVAKTHCYREAMIATGFSNSALYRASIEGDFKFQPDPNFNRFGGLKSSNQDRDLMLCERLGALRDIGISRNTACKQLEISYSVIVRLVKQYGLDFPVKELGQ